VSISKLEDALVIYVDGDACPVKDEVFRVAGRHKLLTRVAANTWLRLPTSPLIELSVVTEGLDAADDWIVENISIGDIVVTSDILLAARCLEKEATVLNPNGKPFNQNNIGSALANRELMASLRDRGEIRGHNPTFSKQDRVHFLNALEKAVQFATSRSG